MKILKKRSIGCIKQTLLQMIMNKLAYETCEKYLITVSKMIVIAIGDRKATIAIAIGDLFSNGDRDRYRDIRFDQDRDRDRNFRDRGHALLNSHSELF